MAKLIRVSKADDLALFSLEEEGEEYLESISLNTPEEWEELCAVGFPQGMLKRIGKTYSTNWQDQFAYQFSSNKSSHFYGISGAPLVKQDREVTGMIIKADDNILVSTTPMVINNFLEGKTGFNCPESASMTDCIAEEEKKLCSRNRNHFISLFAILRIFRSHQKSGKGKGICSTLRPVTKKIGPRGLSSGPVFTGSNTPVHGRRRVELN